MNASAEKTYDILVIDDDFTSSSVLKAYLESKKIYQVSIEHDGQTGLHRATSEKFDCLILDINLPEINGYEILRLLRLRGIQMQVLIISVRGREKDIIMGLELGADDYLIKPFSMPELNARLSARIRRSPNPSGHYQAGDQKVNLDELTIESLGYKHQLSAREGRLLKIFLENPGRVMARNQILDLVWGVDYLGTTRTVDNFVLNLRKKLKGGKITIETVRGLGYRLQNKSSEN
tara:strand:- start:305 stop:1006 length:702 start_codon:yes stop_codon:yes gene_type:complete